MRHALRTLLAVLLVANPVLSLAGDQPQIASEKPPLSTQTPTGMKEGTKGSIVLGGWNSSLSGSPDLVSPYNPADLTSALGGASFDNGKVLFDVRVQDKNDLDGVLKFDLGRVWRSHTTYTRFLPRLGHDPVDYLQAVVRSGRIVQRTDTAPGASYEYEEGVFETRNEIQPKGLSALTIGVDYRDQRRKGAHQGLVISHCDTCHTYSVSRPVDETLRRYNLNAKLAWSGGFVRGEVGKHELRNDAAPMTMTYDKALQPELRTPIFDNRVAFDSLEGPQRVLNQQDVDKPYGKADLSLADILGFKVNVGGVWSKTENKYTGLEADYNGYVLQTSRSFGKARLRFRGRAYSISSDSVYVDTNERTAPAGPQAGKTYRDVYGFNPDYTRLSTSSRDVLEANTEVSVKLGKKAGTLRALWNYQGVDRDNYYVAPGETKTSTNVLGASWRLTPVKGLKLNADYRHGDVENPLMIVNGTCSNIPAIGPLPSPLAPGSIQYFTVHESRVAETTASPAQWDEVRLYATVAGSKSTLTATYRYWDGENREGDLTDWSRNQQALTATAWTAPSLKWDAFASYTYQKGEIGSRVCVPVFDG
jgi:hypothetical protein